MTDNQISALLIGAFRYYCGRMSYAVSSFCELLIQEWPKLPDHTKSIIKQDLLEEFDRDDRARENGSEYKPLGHDCDRQPWENVRGLCFNEKETTTER
jgi:hypothetical protein